MVHGIIASMRNKSKLFFDFIKRHKIWSVVAILLLAGIFWYFFRNNPENVKYNTTQVVRGSISEIVSVTGNVKPLSSVDLAFERGGKIAGILVTVGNKVFAGQPLIYVANDDLTASLDQAQANSKKAFAQYQDIKNGTRAEQITLLETQVDRSTQDLARAKISLVNVIKQSYTSADDAIRNKMYTLFTDPTRYRASLSFSVDNNLQQSIESGKDDINDILNNWNNTLANLDTASDLETYYNNAKSDFLLVKNLLDKCATAVNSLDVVSSGGTQAQSDTWKLNISTARTNVNLAISGLDASYDTYNSSVSALKISQDQLVVSQAGSSQGAILSAEAAYEAAQAEVASAKAELGKAIIKSPIDGVITNIVSKLGEIVPASVNVISVISFGDYEVEVFVPEADIAKIKIGDLASTTLDAYGSGVNFETTVIKIDPAATVIDGVPTYKVTLRFINQDERVKSGMTANLDILTNKKDNTLIIPSRAVSNKIDGKYVSVIDIKDLTEVVDKKIITGIRGADGSIEVISGVNEGDSLVISSTR